MWVGGCGVGAKQQTTDVFMCVCVCCMDVKVAIWFCLGTPSIVRMCRINCVRMFIENDIVSMTLAVCLLYTHIHTHLLYVH